MASPRQDRCTGAARSAGPRHDCFDVAAHTAGTNRGQLPIITDQPNTATAPHNEVDGAVQGQSVGHPGVVDDHQRGPADAFPHSGRSSWWMDQVSFANVSAGAPVASRSCAAGAADGANPTTWPPLFRHARARVRCCCYARAAALSRSNSACVIVP